MNENIKKILESSGGEIYGETALRIVSGDDKVSSYLIAGPTLPGLSLFDSVTHSSEKYLYGRVGNNSIFFKVGDPEAVAGVPLVRSLGLRITSDGEIRDPYDGGPDAKFGVMNTVNDPVLTITKEPNSAMELIVLMARLNLIPTKELADAIKKYGEALSQADSVLVGDAMLRGLQADPDVFIKALDIFDLLPYVSTDIADALSITGNIDYVIDDLKYASRAYPPAEHLLAVLLRRVGVGLVPKKYIPHLSAAMAEMVCIVDFGVSDELAKTVQNAVRFQNTGAKSDEAEIYEIYTVYGPSVIAMIKTMWAGRARHSKDGYPKIMGRINSVVESLEKANG